MTRERIAVLAALIGAATIGGVQVRAWQLDSEVPLAILLDGGIADCASRFVTCPVRVSQVASNFLADAGLNVSPGYHTLGARIRVCVQDDGSRDVMFPQLPLRAGELPPFSIPRMKDCDIAADPGGALWRLRSAQSPCVRAPLDGGELCQRRFSRPFGDGGFAYHGAGNVFPRSMSNGHATCEPASCVTFAGEEQ